VPRPWLLDAYPADDLGGPIYDFLDAYARQRLAYYVTDIVPVLADGATAALLQVEPGTPLVSFDETGYNEANEPIVKAYSYFRDDLLRLRLLRRRV
jgi:DNA-binding GntR family transcriptional regulator